MILDWQGVVSYERRECCIVMVVERSFSIPGMAQKVYDILLPVNSYWVALGVDRSNL